jgi:hypothetical protein
MKRLLAALGLAGVACLTLVLAACTDGLSTTEDNPLLDTDVVRGTVSRCGFPEREATVEIWYWDGDGSGGSWEHASNMVGQSNMSGAWALPYIVDARGHDGIATATKLIGQVWWSGVSAPFYYPESGGEITGVDIELTCD